MLATATSSFIMGWAMTFVMVGAETVRLLGWKEARKEVQEKCYFKKD